MVNKCLSPVEIIILDKRWKEYRFLSRPKVCKFLLLVLKYMHIKCKQFQTTLHLCNDEEIAKLNKKYRKLNKPTDTLSFPITDVTPPNWSELCCIEGIVILGDIFLSLETMQKDALNQNKDFKHHTYHILLHSFLHLLGYDHIKEKDRECMEALEIEILHKVGIVNPYV